MARWRWVLPVAGMDEQAPSVSPALSAANRRLYELRAQAQTARQAISQSAGEPARSAHDAAPWESAAVRPGGARALVEKIASLPGHLGWGSVALTAAVRQQRSRARRVMRPRDALGGATAHSAVFGAGGLSAARYDDRRTRLEQVKLYPDIGLGMLRTGQAAAGRLWLLLKFLDGAGQGALRIDIANQSLTTPTSAYYLCSRRQLRNLLKAGDDIFWARDKERIWLRSAARVAHALGVERLSGRPVALPVFALLNGIGAFRAHLYAAFHSSRVKETAHGAQAMPISRAALAELSGVGGSSQRAYEAQADVEVQTNYAVGEAATKEAKENRAWRHGRALFELTDHYGRQGRRGHTYLAWQLPNSYIGAHAQLPKGRQKRINRKLRDLVTKGTPGNGERTVESSKPKQCYFPNGKLATTAPGQGVDRQRYWRLQCAGTGRQAIWQQVVEAAAGRSGRDT